MVQDGASYRNLIVFESICSIFAAKWYSFSEVEGQFQSAVDIKQLIHLFFQTLENMHGKIFVSTALALITASKEGLSASELEGTLLCILNSTNKFFRYYIMQRRCSNVHL